MSLNVGTPHAITQVSHHEQHRNDILKTGSSHYIFLLSLVPHPPIR